jgi:hypothetical protein
MLAAHGVGAFVYDKRGTGGSGGEFTANFLQLADDAAAAAQMLAERSEVDPQRIGFAGFSQGGWVAPLAAARFPATRAVLVAYGAVGSPFDEDRWQCQRALGGEADPKTLTELNRWVDATHALLARNLQGDWSEYKRATRQVKRQSWFKQVRPEQCIAAGFASYPAWMVRAFAGRRLPPGLDWTYDSTRLLQQNTVPMLWLLAEQDSEAPTALTATALRTLVQAGHPIEIQILAGAEHGMLLFDETSGVRVSTGYHPEYFSRSLDFWTEHLRMP